MESIGRLAGGNSGRVFMLLSLGRISCPLENPAFSLKTSNKLGEADPHHGASSPLRKAHCCRQEHMCKVLPSTMETSVD